MCGITAELLKNRFKLEQLCSNADHQCQSVISLLSASILQCHLLFDSLQDLVDHINDFHVKPEKDSGYCCQWEGCARNGRGFNARYVHNVVTEIS